MNIILNTTATTTTIQSNIKLNKDQDAIRINTKNQISSSSSLSSSSSSSILFQYPTSPGQLTPDSLLSDVITMEFQSNNLETKLDSIYSLASILNCRNLQQNSQILLNLTESKEYCKSMRQSSSSNFIKILTQIIYDEWREIYEYLENIMRLRKEKEKSIQNSNNLLIISSSSTISPSSTSSLETNTQSSFLNQTFPIDNDKLVEIIATRLSARTKAKKALTNIITSSELSNQEDLNLNKNHIEMKILEILTVITEFNERILNFILNKIIKEKNDLAYLNCNLMNLDKLNELKDSVGDLLHLSFDEKQKKNLVDLGVLLTICELIEIIWNFFDHFNFDIDSISTENNQLQIDIDIKNLLNKISLEAIIILNNLTFLDDSNLINVFNICSRRFTLNGIYKCLDTSYVALNKKCNASSFFNRFKYQDIEFDLIKIIASLIKNLNNSTKLSSNSSINNTTLSPTRTSTSTTNKNYLFLDNQTKLSIYNFNEFNFIELLTKCLLIYSTIFKNKKFDTDLNSYFNFNQFSSTLKTILNALLNLSYDSIENKVKLCNVNGSIKYLIELISQNTLDDSITELSICLIRSLSVYFSMNDLIRQDLVNLNFYKCLLDNLNGSNLNVVSNVCCIFWSMTSRSNNDNDILIKLGAHIRLKSLASSTNKLISMASMATLKNLFSNIEINDQWFESEPSTATVQLNSISSDAERSLNLSNSSSRMTTSISSSSSIYSNNIQQAPLLANRNRKQSLETSNEFLKQLKNCNLKTKLDNFPLPKETQLLPTLLINDESRRSNLNKDNSASLSSLNSQDSSFSSYSSSESTITSTTTSTTTDTDSSSSSSSSDSIAVKLNTKKNTSKKKQSYYLNGSKSKGNQRSPSKHSYYLNDQDDDYYYDEQNSISDCSNTSSEYDNTSLTSKINPILILTGQAVTKKSIIKVKNNEKADMDQAIKSAKHVTFNEKKLILCEDNEDDYSSIKRPNRINKVLVNENQSNNNIEIIDLLETPKPSKIFDNKITPKISVDSMSFRPKKKEYSNSNKISPSTSRNNWRSESSSPSPISNLKFIKSNSLIFNNSNLTFNRKEQQNIGNSAHKLSTSSLNASKDNLTKLTSCKKITLTPIRPFSIGTSTISSLNKQVIKKPENNNSSTNSSVIRKSESNLSINTTTNNSKINNNANMTSWSSIVTMTRTSQMRYQKNNLNNSNPNYTESFTNVSSVREKLNSPAKPPTPIRKLVGLVRPIVPLKQTISSNETTNKTLSSSNNKINRSNENINKKEEPIRSGSARRLQVSNLLKKNQFIIDDQLKKKHFSFNNAKNTNLETNNINNNNTKSNSKLIKNNNIFLLKHI